MMITAPKREGGERLRGKSKESSAGVPLVSVVTVVLNGEQHLESAIVSVLGQSYPNIEYIVIDGGSHDGTLDIIHKYETRLAYWVSEPDHGIFDAMNKGINLASGEFIGILNADDIYSPSAIELVVATFLANPDVQIVHGKLRFIQESGIEEIWSSKSRLSRRYIYKMPVNHPTVFVRSDCYKKCGTFDTCYPVVADLDLMLRFLVDYSLRFHYLDVVLTTMRGGGASGKFSLKILREIEEILRKRGVPFLCLIRCRLGYLWLIFVQRIKRQQVISRIFSFYHAMRLWYQS